MNGRQKGRRIEKEFEDLLKQYGFLVNPTPAGTMFNRHTDHWGMFDAEAISIIEPALTFLFQIATRWKCGQELKAIEQFPASPWRKVFMVRRKDRKEFELKEWVGGRWMDEGLTSFLNCYGKRI